MSTHNADIAFEFRWNDRVQRTLQTSFQWQLAKKSGEYFLSSQRRTTSIHHTKVSRVQTSVRQTAAKARPRTRAKVARVTVHVCSLARAHKKRSQTELTVHRLGSMMQERLFGTIVKVNIHKTKETISCMIRQPSLLDLYKYPSLSLSYH